MKDSIGKATPKYLTSNIEQSMCRELHEHNVNQPGHYPEGHR
jgi:hypothetical protein